MRGKNVWTKRFYFSYKELDALAEFLEDKAANGWEMTSLLGNTFGFRKTEPRQVRFSVEIVEADTDETQKLQFIEYCEADGWKHIYDFGKLQFFENENPDADSIHTDEEVKLDLVYRHCRGLSIGLNLSMAAIALLISGFLIWNLDYRDMYTSGIVVNIFVLITLAMMALYQCIEFCLWYRRSKQAVTMGKAPRYKQNKVARFLDIAIYIWATAAIWLDDVVDAFYSQSTVLIALVFFFIIGTAGFIFLYNLYQAKFNKDGKTHTGLFLLLGVAFVALMVWASYTFFMPASLSEDEGDVFLTVQEMGETSTGTTEHWVVHEGSPLDRHERGSDRWGSKKVYYELYTARFEKFYDEIVEEMYFARDKEYEEVEDKAFGADKVYLLGKAESLTMWLLLYDEKILYLETRGFDLSDKQKEMIGEKVKAEER